MDPEEISVEDEEIMEKIDGEIHTNCDTEDFDKKLSEDIEQWKMLREGISGKAKCASLNFSIYQVANNNILAFIKWLIKIF